MRFDWDDSKYEKVLSERGIDFFEAIVILENDHILFQKNDNPEQWLAVGLIDGQMISLVYEDREDDSGQYVWVITCWASTKTEEKKYYETFKS